MSTPVPNLRTNIHHNDVGVRIILKYQRFDEDLCRLVVLPITGATSQEIRFLKPGGAVVVNPTTFETDGSDGLAGYTTVGGDLDEVGLWKAQGRVTIPAGTFSSTIEKFQVDENL